MPFDSKVEEEVLSNAIEMQLSPVGTPPNPNSRT